MLDFSLYFNVLINGFRPPGVGFINSAISKQLKTRKPSKFSTYLHCCPVFGILVRWTHSSLCSCFLQPHWLTMCFTLCTLAFPLSLQLRKCHSYSVYTYLIGWLAFHFSLNGDENKVTLLWANISQWLWYVSSSRRTVKGRCIPFPDTLLSSFLATNKGQDCRKWALQSEEAKRQSHLGTYLARGAALAPLITYMVFQGTLSSPLASEELSGGKKLCTCQHTSQRIGGVVRGKGSLQRFIRTEWNQG